MSNHSHGYHGSSAGLCIHCGSGAPETEYCELATQYEANKRAYRDRQHCIAAAALKKLSKAEIEAISYVASTLGSLSAFLHDPG